MKKIWVLLLAVGLVFSFTGCPVEDKDNNEGTSVEFTSFSPPSIFVENLTAQRLVAFKGSIGPNTLISGIPANSGQHGLKKVPSLFYDNGTFVMLLITEADYNANKNNLSASPIFARVFAFYNHGATNNNVFEISGLIGGAGSLNVSNPTPYNVEIRSGSPTGQILGYAAAGATQGNVIKLQAREDPYDIYPVFKFYDDINKELYSVTPKYTSGALIGQSFMQRFGIGGNELNHSFNLSAVQNMGGFNLSSGSMYLRVNNNSGTAVSFWDGTINRITSTGVKTINVNRSEVFSLPFTMNADKTYPAERTFAQLIIDLGQRTIQIPSQSYKLDTMYEIDISGNNVSEAVIGTVREGERIDLEKLFGLTD